MELSAVWPASTSIHNFVTQTQYIKAANGVTFAYRRLGASTGRPLVLHIHFRANMDLWDPLLIDNLAAKRPVIIFDQAGVGRSDGKTAETFQGWANNVIALLDALKITEIDLLGFSMGGCAVQQIALTRPSLVHKLIIGGSGSSEPGEQPVAGVVWPRDVPPEKPITWLATSTGVEDFKGSLEYSFFPETDAGRKAAAAYFKRIEQRSAQTSGGEELMLEPLGEEGTKAQSASWADYCVPNPNNAFDRLGELKMPVLIQNGDDDQLVSSSRSFEMLKFINNAQLILYPRSGHGYIWQYAERVAEDVNKFLDFDL
ncbi:hypothetical protein LTR17_020330 [Elasticomyces elasticus]|nr:hypothetical protein LTR17_020330 [Elasticomyces elasticus]